MESNDTGTVFVASHTSAGETIPTPPSDTIRHPPSFADAVFGDRPTTLAPHIGYRDNTSRNDDINPSRFKVDRNTYRKGRCSCRKCTSVIVRGTRKAVTTEVERNIRSFPVVVVVVVVVVVPRR